MKTENEFLFYPCRKVAPARSGFSCVAGQWQEFVLSNADCTELVLRTKGVWFLLVSI